MTTPPRPLDRVLDHVLDRTILITAPREVVFGFFTDSARWATWWGAGSTIDARPGGAVTIRYPDGSEARGEVLEVSAPSLLRFTFGYVRGTPIGPGESTVTIRLDSTPVGTRLSLHHAFGDAAARDAHVGGWRYQLALFSNAVSDEAFARAVDAVDAWNALWAEADPARRRAALARWCDPAVTMRDRFSLVAGADELDAQIEAVLRHRPGIHLERVGGVQHNQGVVLARWRAVNRDRAQVGTGSNVVTFAADGRIAGVVGFWDGSGE